MAIYYLDSNATGVADGTSATDAYTTWTDLITADATLTGDTVLIAKGSVFRENIAISSQNTITFQTYGTGEDPIFNGSDINASWTSIGSDQYTITIAAIHGVWVNDVEMVAVGTIGALVNNTVFHTGTTLTIQTSVNPNLVTTEVTARETALFTSCHTIIMNGVHFTKSDSTGLKFFKGATNCQILNCVSTKCGSWDASSNASFSVLEDNGVTTLHTGFVMNNCISEQSQNGGFECANLDGAKVTGLSFTNCGMGLELWGNVLNSKFEQFTMRNIVKRGTFNAHENFIWIAHHTQSATAITGNVYNNILTGFDCIECVGNIGIYMDSGVKNTFANSTFVQSTNSTVFPLARVYNSVSATVTWTAGAGTLTVAHTAHTLATGDYVYIHTAATSDIAEGYYPITVTGVNEYTITDGATAEPTSAEATTCYGNIFNNNIMYVNDVTCTQYVFREDSNVASDLDNNYIYSTSTAVNLVALIDAVTYRTTAPTKDDYVTLYGGSVVTDPLLTDVDSDANLLPTSTLIGAGSKWWTGANPPGADGEPFSDFDTDVGAIQSTLSPFHPVKL